MLDPSQEDLVKLESGAEVQSGIVQADVDPRLERRVDAANAVGGQKQNPGVVLETSQEDTGDGIASEVAPVPLGEEDVCLVQEQYTSPFVRHAEIALQAPFHLDCRLTNVSARNGEQRSLGPIGYTFGS